MDHRTQYDTKLRIQLGLGFLVKILWMRVNVSLHLCGPKGQWANMFKVIVLSFGHMRRIRCKGVGISRDIERGGGVN